MNQDDADYRQAMACAASMASDEAFAHSSHAHSVGVGGQDSAACSGKRRQRDRSGQCLVYGLADGLRRTT